MVENKLNSGDVTLGVRTERNRCISVRSLIYTKRWRANTPKQTFIGSLGRTPFPKRVIHCKGWVSSSALPERSRMLRDAGALWWGFTQQLDRRQSMTQQFAHKTPRTPSFGLTPQTKKQTYSTVAVMNPAPSAVLPSSCRASTADYTLLSELALSLLPAAGVKVSPLNSLCVIITDAEVVAGAARR